MGHLNCASLLPVEIWRECFMLLDITEHKKLAKTCRFFRDICLAFIFKSIQFSSRIAFHKHGEPHEMTIQLDNLAEKIGRFNELAKSPQYAPLVRKCSLHYSIRLAAATDEAIAKLGKDAYDPFVKAFVQCIPAFINLREVEIHLMRKMDKRILAALTALPQLERLSLPSVRFGAHQLKPLLKVKDLSIDNSVGSDCNPNKTAKSLDIFSAEHIERLSVLSEVYAPKIFLALTNRGPSKKLTHLSLLLNSKDLAALYSFLATCPKLESIQLNLGTHEEVMDISFLPLPKSTVPHLKCFTGPDAAAKIFVPGRPVNQVSLVQHTRWSDRKYSEMEDIIPILSRSTGPIIHLDIETITCTPELLALISTHFPDLTQLTLALDSERVFPEQDPPSIKLDVVVAANEVRSSEKTVIELAEETFPAQFHGVYLSLMHWIALRRIDLPANLKSFSLLKPFYIFFLDEPDPDEESRKYGKPYTFAAAESVLNSLSTHYPALEQIVIGEANDGMAWIRGTTGRWAFQPRRPYSGWKVIK